MSTRQWVMRSRCKHGQILWSLNDFHWSCILYSLQFVLQALIKNNFFLHFQEFKSFNFMCTKFLQSITVSSYILTKEKLKGVLIFKLNTRMSNNYIMIVVTIIFINTLESSIVASIKLKPAESKKFSCLSRHHRICHSGNSISYKKYQLSLTLALECRFCLTFSPNLSLSAEFSKGIWKRKKFDKLTWILDC